MALRAEVRQATQRLREAGVQPGLTVVLVGEDPASQVYVRNKDRAATDAGFAVHTVRLPAGTSQGDLEACVEDLNQDPSVHGILVQLPLPGDLDERAVVRRLLPSKDVDGLTPENVAALVLGGPGHRPCTPAGCVELLDRHDIALEGKRVTVVGRSMLVGKPFASLALARNATVTLCHSRTPQAALIEHCQQADVLVAAVGRARLIQGDWIRPGGTVLDVGINRGADGKLVGDVDFDAAVERAGSITPVPGGIGPMTIAMLLRNTLAAAAQTKGMDVESLLRESSGS